MTTAARVTTAPAAAVRPGPANSKPARLAIPSGDWMTFDYNVARTGVGPAVTGITAANLHSLKRRTVQLNGTVDSAPIELHAIRFGSHPPTARDVIVMTTSYGRTLALDAQTGRTLWEFTPASYGRLAGSALITAASPVADPDRAYVYAASPDGFIRKLSSATGRVVWATSITFDATHEKLPSALNIEGTNVLVTTDGYIGDAPPYQGKVVAIDMASGRITDVFNSLCSNERHLIDPPSSCPASDAGIWGRPGTVIEADGNVLVATGNAPFNGTTDWGDSVLELSPTLQLLHSWTPTDQAQLNSDDGDLGSTEPALLPEQAGSPPLAVQGGKAGVFSVLDLNALDGTTGPAGARTGGELQDIATPGGGAAVRSQPAVWTHGGGVYMIAADDSGTTAYRLAGDRLAVAWQDGTPGTSPVIAGGLLYIYDDVDGVLVVRSPASGRVLDTLPAAPGHWNSPIVVGGRIILPEGNDNDHATTGTLDIYHLPGR